MTFTSKGSCEEIVPQLSGEHKDSYAATVYCVGLYTATVQ